MWSNELEKKALWEKMDNPDKRIICPRCGNEIVIVERGNSTSIECKTKKCIFAGIRGI